MEIDFFKKTLAEYEDEYLENIIKQINEMIKINNFENAYYKYYYSGWFRTLTKLKLRILKFASPEVLIELL